MVASKGADGEGSGGSGTGDMLKSTYDPTNKQSDVFSMDNMVETSTKKIMTAEERIDAIEQAILTLMEVLG